MKISRYCIYEIILFHVFLVFYYYSFTNRNDWKVSGLLFFLIFCLLFLEYLRTRLFVSPLFFWFAFWLGAITIGRMNLGIGVYPLFREWSVKLLMIVLLNTLVFFWVYWLGEFSTFKKKKAERVSKRCDNEKLADIVIAVLIVACFAFILNVIHTGVIPQLTGNANAYRSSFVATRYYQIVSVLRFSLACVPLAYKDTSSRIKKVLLILLTGAYILEEMLTGWRGYTLQGMILLITSTLIVSGTDKKVQIRNFVLISSTVLIAVAFIIYITITRDGTFEVVEERVKYAVNTFYLYIAPNFLNFQTAVEKVQPKGFLMYTAEAVWGVFLPAWENPLYIWDDVEYNIGAFNVCTYFLEPYCDLGTAGTVIWSAVISFVSGWAFQKTTMEKNVFALVLLGISNITIFMLHNNFFLRSSSFLIWLILSFFINRVSTDRVRLNGKKII